MDRRLLGYSSSDLLDQEAADRTVREPIVPSEVPCVIIFPDGDVVVNCIPAPGGLSGLGCVTCRLRTNSASLREASDYFSVLLDPAKFQEGREFTKTIEGLQSQYGSLESALYQAEIDELPQVTLQLPPLSSKINKTAILTVFFRLLAHAGCEESSDTAFSEDVAKNSITFLACLATLLDRYGAPNILKQVMEVKEVHDNTLKLADSESQRWKLRHRLRTFRSDDEERVREAIYLAYSLNDQKAFGFLTHKLAVGGSREWHSAVDDDQAGISRPIWWRLPGGIEEEMQFRNQCILDTISDYQSHLLCAYGASATFPKSSASFSPSARRELQCRRAYENSRACDSFHLGEMIHFFTTRAKTLELKSALSSPQLNSDDEYNGEHEADNSRKKGIMPSKPATLRLPTDITAIIAALRQCPEYQIDSNHVGCGIRRRLIAVLDCIEGFTKSRDAMGICLHHCDLPSGRGSWANDSFRNALGVHVRGSSVHLITTNYKVRSASQPDDSLYSCDCFYKGQTARFLFTAKHRKWE
ncbi:hypothetical protein PRK78_000107 [Emydomyces testavorans]|uniref:Uncharacterized protein n=1 Tax=Emydomyces testavorans TaxID=2070801 RepID=A0AAF0IE42_9EURO|nr:hypothetical protein PRK78_000107 [Emydomyces testavorans]